MSYFSRFLGDFKAGMDSVNFEKYFDEFFEMGSSFMDAYTEVKGDPSRLKNYESLFQLIQTKIDLLVAIVNKNEKRGTLQNFIKQRIKTTNFKSLSINDALVLISERVEMLNSAVKKELLHIELL